MRNEGVLVDKRLGGFATAKDREIPSQISEGANADQVAMRSKLFDKGLVPWIHGHDCVHAGAAPGSDGDCFHIRPPYAKQHDKNNFVKIFDKFNFVMYIFIETKERNMSIKIIVGQVATGDDFFNRKNEINILWQRILSGSNIILKAWWLSNDAN